jgi:hypothetical protein
MQAAAVIGNLMAESSVSLDPRTQQGACIESTCGRGIGQWNEDGRWQELLAFAKDRGASPYSLRTQLAFIVHELNSSYAYAFRSLTAATTLDAATLAFMTDYEQCNPIYCDPEKRLGYAHQVFGG